MIRSKPSTDEYREAWERVFGDGDIEHSIVKGLCNVRSFCSRCNYEMTDTEANALSEQVCPGCGAVYVPFVSARNVDNDERKNNWPVSHESDCPARIGDPCRCPVGNL